MLSVKRVEAMKGDKLDEIIAFCKDFELNAWNKTVILQGTLALLNEHLLNQKKKTQISLRVRELNAYTKPTFSKAEEK